MRSFEVCRRSNKILRLHRPVGPRGIQDFEILAEEIVHNAGPAIFRRVARAIRNEDEGPKTTEIEQSEAPGISTAFRPERWPPELDCENPL